VNLLLVEDDTRLGKLMKMMLEDSGYQVTWSLRGDDALIVASDPVYDLAVLDWMLPGLSGVDLCRQMRQDGWNKPILMLTAKDAVSDRVTGLDSGADDYLTKPFEFDELHARLRALSRRGNIPIQEDVVNFSGFCLERSSRLLTCEGIKIPLSPREFRLLDLLVRNRGKVVPREVLLDRVWGMEEDVSDNNLDAHIRLLRKKLETSDHASPIRTIRGVGYKLEE
jgi:DNA-binding response OmpR family regulator